MIKGIIFDLGHTLIHLTRDWQSVMQEGAEAVADWYFKKKRIKLDSTALVETFIAECTAGQALAQQTETEILAAQTLSDTLKKIGAPSSTTAFVEAAIKIYFDREEMAWQAYPDAVDTLKQLKGQYRLGLYSNAADDKFIQRLVNRHRFRPLLAPTFSSAGQGWRKPKREAFELIAKSWRLAPEQILVVGDTLNADILGAQNAGMPGILVTMNEPASNDQNRHIRPTAVASSLAELPPLIRQL